VTQPRVHTLADVAAETGTDLDTLRAIAAQVFNQDPAAYNPHTETVNEWARGILVTALTSHDPDAA
jgi:hypothetical protein